MTEPIRPRPRPCATCPYRRDVPSGVWEPSEYVKLLAWDGEADAQSLHGFRCHSQDGHLCSGWVAHRGDPGELLAIRLGVAMGWAAPDTLDYSTDVPLFGSGAEAAEHGMAEVETPGPEAVKAIAKVMRAREGRGR